MQRLLRCEASLPPSLLRELLSRQFGYLESNYCGNEAICVSQRPIAAAVPRPMRVNMEILLTLLRNLVIDYTLANFRVVNVYNIAYWQGQIFYIENQEKYNFLFHNLFPGSVFYTVILSDNQDELFAFFIKFTILESRIVY
jgi:hypothetical protein